MIGKRLSGSWIAAKSDLPVLLPFEPFKRNEDQDRLDGWLEQLGILVIGGLIAAIMIGTATAGPNKPGIIATMIKWTPLLAKGFAFNILISFLAMAIGTVLGLGLGLLQISLLLPVRFSSWFVTQFFRNSPWLVLLFYSIFMIPFEFEVYGVIIPMPDWIKAVVGLSLPIMANVSEIVRGAIRSVPAHQWEASESLAFTRFQMIWQIILPQCVKRMIPPWMNWYAILTMATPLVSVVGVSEAMTFTGEILAAEQRDDLLIPMYLYLLSWFFIYCYPIAKWTQHMERKYAVRL
jgi:polar amino acid transport system permease protein